MGSQNICAYEQERLDNIARNEAMLASLGLGQEKLCAKTKAPPKPRRKSDDDDDADPVHVRRSSRVANTPVQYTELSDEFCTDEERRLNGRPSRDRKRTITYAERQAAEIEEAEQKNAQRRVKQQRAMATEL